MRMNVKWTASNLLLCVGIILAVILAGLGLLGRWSIRQFEGDPAAAEHKTLNHRFAKSDESITARLARSRAEVKIRPRAAAPAPPPETPVPAVAGAPEPAPAVRPLKLTAILWSTNQPVAIMNGAEAAVGGEIQGYRVIEIREHSVHLKNAAGETLVLELYD